MTHKIIDDKRADGLIELCRARDTDPDNRAERAMWRAAAEFTIRTGENELAFFERGARQFISFAFGLYPEAARRYLGAIVDAHLPDATPEMRRYALRNAALAVEELYEALRLAARDTEGNC